AWASSTNPGRGPAPQYPNTTPSFMATPVSWRSFAPERTLLAVAALHDLAHDAPAFARADARLVSRGRRRSVGRVGGPRTDHLHQPRLDRRPQRGRGPHRARAALHDDHHPPRARRSRGRE